MNNWCRPSCLGFATTGQADIDVDDRPTRRQTAVVVAAAGQEPVGG